MQNPKNKCVFLDRDGVLNEEIGDYMHRLEDLVFPVGMAEGLQLLKEAGYLLIVVTNQAGIAKGMYGHEAVHAIHQCMQEECGNLLDAIYFAPHHPAHSSRSLSRKPESLMLEKAIAKYTIDPSQSWMIGDRARDMEAGKKAGVRTIHILTEGDAPAGDYTALNLLEAARLIVGREKI
ncbi:HAD family hydrolase [Telluribacter sp.]|uniref:D-glycero-alpha-D-manno-heptose-1,7-bisphosphate 7-phosphatase n=1 Tax=Telluribacter sp. TaxID=1978767 RepID=UPI002E0E5C59|nr:HAD family hydrolase [Telluribacter sp.]